VRFLEQKHVLQENLSRLVQQSDFVSFFIETERIFCRSVQSLILKIIIIEVKICIIKNAQYLFFFKRYCSTTIVKVK